MSETLETLVPPPASVNPLLKAWQTPFETPPFAEIAPEHFLPAFEQAFADHTAEITAITYDPSVPDFANTVTALERAGTCVTLGVSASAEVTFDARQFFVAGRTTLYGLYLFTEFASEPATIGLRRLAELVAAGQLAPHISLERPWGEIAQVAQDLMNRRFPGKAVLTIE